MLLKVQLFNHDSVPKNIALTNRKDLMNYLIFNQKIYKVVSTDIEFDGIVISDSIQNNEAVVEVLNGLSVLDKIEVEYTGSEYKSSEEIINYCKNFDFSCLIYPNLNFSKEIRYIGDSYGLFDKEKTEIVVNTKKSKNLIDNFQLEEINGNVYIKVFSKNKKRKYDDIMNLIKNKKFIKLNEFIDNNEDKDEIYISDFISNNKHSDKFLFKPNDIELIPENDCVLWKSIKNPYSITLKIISSDNKFLNKMKFHDAVKERLTKEYIYTNDVFEVYCDGRIKFKIDSVLPSSKSSIFLFEENTGCEFIYDYTGICSILENEKTELKVDSVDFLVEKSYEENNDKNDLLEKLLKISNDKFFSEKLISLNITAEGKYGYYPKKDNVIKVDNYKLTIKNIKFEGEANPEQSCVIKFHYYTKFNFESINPDITFLRDNSTSKRAKITVETIKGLREKISNLGLAGMDEIIDKVIKNVLISRTELLPEHFKSIIKPNRGIIFHGPPGTGKTSLARSLAKVLDIQPHNIKMLTAPEVFSKWVGDSEKFVRELFEPAKKAYQLDKEKAPMFLIIIDEIEAVLGQRGKFGDSSVRESVVNQFLGEMDGLNQIDNFLVIGLTNRLELIDTAALRSGRFGCHIEISYPTEKQRKDIFEMYMKRLNVNETIFKDINTDELAAMTSGLVGADIEQIYNNCIDKYLMERLEGNIYSISHENILETTKRLYNEKYGKKPFIFAKVLI